MTPGSSRCCSVRRPGSACRRPRPRSAPPTSASRGCAAATRSCSPTACRSTAPGRLVQPAAGAAARSRAGRSDQGRRVRAVRPAALGGVINLVSRRPRDSEREALFNVTSQRRARHDALARGSAAAAAGRGPCSAAFTGSRASDLDDDGWTDLAGFRRVVRAAARVLRNGQGRVAVRVGRVHRRKPRRRNASRAGWRRTATRLPNRSTRAAAISAPRALGHLRREGHLDARIVRAAGQDRTFGEVRERGARAYVVWRRLGERRGRRTPWVRRRGGATGSLSCRPPPRFRYTLRVPAVFVQDEIAVAPGRRSRPAHGSTCTASTARSRARVSRCWPAGAAGRCGCRPAAAFAPTPFTEETDETGLSRVSRCQASRPSMHAARRPTSPGRQVHSKSAPPSSVPR